MVTQTKNNYGVIWRLKACPRCGGDIFIDSDMDTWYAQCLQCSHRLEMESFDERNYEPEPIVTRTGRPESVR